MMRNGLLYLVQSTSYDFENVPQNGTSFLGLLYKKNFTLGVKEWGGDKSAIERLELPIYKAPQNVDF